MFAYVLFWALFTAMANYKRLSALVEEPPLPVALLFPGQGSQYVGASGSIRLRL